MYVYAVHFALKTSLLETAQFAVNRSQLTQECIDIAYVFPCQVPYDEYGTLSRGKPVIHHLRGKAWLSWQLSRLEFLWSYFSESSRFSSYPVIQVYIKMSKPSRSAAFTDQVKTGSWLKVRQDCEISLPARHSFLLYSAVYHNGDLGLKLILNAALYRVQKL